MNRLWKRFVNLFRRDRFELWITYNKDDRVFGEPAPIRESHRFVVKKKIKITPKHIRFRDHQWRLVEIKSVKPMDYMLRDIEK